MLDINSLVQWQRVDPNSGIVFPWWTDGAIDRLRGMAYGEVDLLQHRVVLEFGGGWSTIWLAKHCSHIYTVEANLDWARDIKETLDAYNLGHKATVMWRGVNEGDQSRAAEYLGIPPGVDPDIICVDGILRDNCLEMAINLPPRRRIVIADNWYQSYVWMSDSAVAMMAPYEREIFEQENHTDNDGINKWKTAIFYLP